MTIYYIIYIKSSNIIIIIGVVFLRTLAKILKAQWAFSFGNSERAIMR